MAATIQFQVIRQFYFRLQPHAIVAIVKKRFLAGGKIEEFQIEETCGAPSFPGVELPKRTLKDFRSIMTSDCKIASQCC